MPAHCAYEVRGVPPQLDAELRREARTTGRSLNTVDVEALAHAKLPADRLYADLDSFVGSAQPGARTEREAAQQWLDALPAELP